MRAEAARFVLVVWADNAMSIHRGYAPYAEMLGGFIFAWEFDAVMESDLPMQSNPRRRRGDFDHVDGMSDNGDEAR